jgi:hypothetical protein
VFREQLPHLLDQKPLELFVRDAVASSLSSSSSSSSSSPSLPHRTCLAKAAVLAGTHTVAEACRLLVAGTVSANNHSNDNNSNNGGNNSAPQPPPPRGLSGVRGASVENCREALEVLRSFLGGGGAQGEGGSNSAPSSADADSDAAAAVGAAVEQWLEAVKARFPLVQDWS